MDLKFFLIFIQITTLQLCDSQFSSFEANNGNIYNNDNVSTSSVAIESLLRNGKSNDPFFYKNNTRLSLDLVRCILTKDSICVYIKSNTKNENNKINKSHKNHSEQEYGKPLNQKIHENFRASKRILSLNNIDNKDDKKENNYDNNYTGTCKHCDNQEKPLKGFEHHEVESNEQKSFKKRRSKRETGIGNDQLSDINETNISNKLDYGTLEEKDNGKDHIKNGIESSLLKSKESKLNNLSVSNNEIKKAINGSDGNTNESSMCKNCILVNSVFPNFNQTQDLILNEIIDLLDEEKD